MENLELIRYIKLLEEKIEEQERIIKDFDLFLRNAHHNSVISLGTILDKLYSNTITH